MSVPEELQFFDITELALIYQAAKHGAKFKGKPEFTDEEMDRIIARFAVIRSQWVYAKAAMAGYFIVDFDSETEELIFINNPAKSIFPTETPLIEEIEKTLQAKEWGKEAPFPIE